MNEGRGSDQLRWPRKARGWAWRVSGLDSSLGNRTALLRQSASRPRRVDMAPATLPVACWTISHQGFFPRPVPPGLALLVHLPSWRHRPVPRQGTWAVPLLPGPVHATCPSLLPRYPQLAASAGLWGQGHQGVAGPVPAGRPGFWG